MPHLVSWLILTCSRSYTTPPALDITLEEFETFAIARLKGLFSLD
jgi:hypothetical protein